MAIDYTADILSLYAGKVVTDPEYAAIPADLRDQPSEQRILTTVEVLRAHLEIIENRTEANLLLESIARLTAKVGSGGFVYTPQQITVSGSTPFPTFASGAGLDVIIGGVTTSCDTPSGGDLDTVISEINGDLSGATAEVSQFTALADAVPGALGGTYLTINGKNGAPTQDYYVWFNHAARPEITDITAAADVAGSLNGTYWTLEAPGPLPHYVWYEITRAEVTDVIIPGDTDGSLGGKYWTLDSPTTPYYCWYNVAARAEVSQITAVADVAGSLNGTYWTLEAPGLPHYVWYEITRAEVTDVIIPGDTDGSLGGKYWTLDDPTTPYYVWYNVAARAEITDVVIPGDTDGSLGGKYWTLDSPTTPYYVWYNVAARAEVSTVTCNAASTLTQGAGNPAGDYFTLNSANDATSYYVWYNVTDAATPNSDPAPGGTGIQVAVLAADLANAVATKTASAINAVIDFGAPAPGANVVTITNAAVGATTDAADVNTGFGVAVTTQGISASVDPAPGGKTALQVNITGDDVANTVASATAAVINGSADFGCPAPGAATITVTNAAVGSVTDAADVDAGVTPTVTTQGISASVDPAPGGKTALQVNISGDDAPNTVATATASVINGSTDFGCPAPGAATITVTNANAGNVTDAADVDAGVAPTVTTQGITAAADPAPGGTGLKVIINAGDAANTIAAATQVVVNGDANFSMPAPVGAVMTVTNAANGSVTDATAGTSGFGASVTTQGISASVDPAPGGKTGIQVNISGDDVANTVATATASAINGLGDFGCPAPGAATITVTNAAVGSVTDAADVDAGVAPTVTAQGIDAAADPAPGGTGLKVIINADDPANTIAAATQVVVNGDANFSMPAPAGAVMTVTNAANGPVTDATAGTSGFGVAVTQQGLDAAVDPAAANNVVVVNYTVGGAAGTIGGEVRAAISAQAGAVFSTGGAGATINVTNILEGDAPDATSGTTGWAAPIVTDGTAGAPVAVEAYKTPDGKLGFRTTPGNEDTSFELADGIGGILAPAGLAAQSLITTKEKVANNARDRALSVYEGQARDANL